MIKHDAPQIKSVQIAKVSRFWNITVDGKLLAIALYKAGAVATQELIQRMAGLPVASDTEEAEEKKPAKKSESKPTVTKSKTKAKPTAASTAKVKPPVKKTEAEPAKSTPEATTAVQ
jgi:flagellar biogenesis protein FliO